MAKKNLKRIAESSTDELKIYAEAIGRENDRTLEKTCSLLKFLSLFDIDVLQHKDLVMVSQLREELRNSGIKDEDMKPLIEFSKVFTCDSSTWESSHEESVCNAYLDLKSRCSTSNSTDEEEGRIGPPKAKYEHLHAISEKVKKRSVATILTPAEAVTKRWRGGSLRDYITDFGDGIVDELIYAYVEEVPNQGTGIAFNDRKVQEKTKKAKRLSKTGKKILRDIMRQVGDTHGCNKVYGELMNVANIKLSPDLMVELPKLDRTSLRHDAETCHADCNKVKGVIRSMLRGDDLTLPKDSPEDVKHLYNLLTSAKDWFDSYHDTILFNHPCLWTPSEMVRNIIVMKMIVADELANRNPKLQSALKEMNTHVDKDWPIKSLLTNRSAYNTMYSYWEADMCRSRGIDLKEFKDIQRENRGFYVLFYMRNCYPHSHEHPEEKKKEEEGEGEEEESKSPLQVENDLYVMFPTYMSEVLVATAKCKFNFKDLDSRHLKMDFE